MLYGRNAMKHHYDYMLDTNGEICKYINDAHEQLGINVVTLREGIASLAVNMIDASLMMSDRCMASVTESEIMATLEDATKIYIRAIDNHAVSVINFREFPF